jgi:hypothetical protein
MYKLQAYIPLTKNYLFRYDLDRIAVILGKLPPGGDKREDQKEILDDVGEGRY